MLTIVNVDARVEALVRFGTTIGANELVFTNDPLIGDLLRSDPFAFLLAASIDRQMAAETAWRVPTKLRAVLGHLDLARIAEMSEDEMLAALMRIDGRPRYPRPAARTIVGAAKKVRDSYAGNARSVWQQKRAWEINRRLQEFYGIGPGIASMTVNLLASLGEITFDADDYASIDVKPDVHVIRVFYRLGFIESRSEAAAVESARRLSPAYPGKLDAPTWHVGRTWCHAERPDCPGCPLSGVCPKRSA